jgi:hypothetical protein
MDLGEIGWGWCGLDWSASGCGNVDGSCEHDSETWGSNKIPRSSSVAVKLGASRDGLSSVELVMLIVN